LALPAKAGFGREVLKGQKSQWCESLQKRRTTPLLSGGSVVGQVLQDGLSFAFIRLYGVWMYNFARFLSVQKIITNLFLLKSVCSICKIAKLTSRTFME